MLQMILNSVDGISNAVELMLTVDRLEDGRTWTYQPTRWRLPGGDWVKLASVQPLQIGEIVQAEIATGYKMNMHGYRIIGSEWVYRFERQN